MGEICTQIPLLARPLASLGNQLQIPPEEDAAPMLGHAALCGTSGSLRSSWRRPEEIAAVLASRAERAPVVAPGQTYLSTLEPARDSSVEEPLTRPTA